MNDTNPYRVLLYYKFVAVPDAELFAAEHLAYCKSLNVKGRILIADEGINGTLSGTMEQTEQYIAHMRMNPLFADMVFKIDEAEQHAFKNYSFAIRKSL